MKQKIKQGLALFALFAATSSWAADFIGIPLPEDVKITTQLQEKLPYVLIAASRQTPDAIIKRIAAQLGEPTKISKRFGRSTHYFLFEGNEVKLTVTNKKGWSQINMMISDPLNSESSGEQ